MKLKKFYIMKTKTIFVLAFFFTILLVVASCTKPTNPLAPIPAAPILTIIAPTGAIPYADSVNFSWQVTGKVTSVTLDGKSVSLSGSHNTGRLLIDQDYTLRAVGPGGSDSKTIAIKVGDWTTSDYGVISHDYWVFDSLGYKTQTMKDFYMYTKKETDSHLFDLSFYFFPTGEYEEKSISTGKILLNDSWDLQSSDTLIIAGDENYIEKLTVTELVLVTRTANSEPTFIRTVYKRDSK